MSTHKKISFVKSGIRIAGYLFGAVAFHAWIFPLLAFLLLALAEGLGIWEEFYEVLPSPKPEYDEDDLIAVIRGAGGKYLGRDVTSDHVLISNPATGSTLAVREKDVIMPGFLIGRLAANTEQAGKAGRIR